MMQKKARLKNPVQYIGVKEGSRLGLVEGNGYGPNPSLTGLIRQGYIREQDLVVRCGQYLYVTNSDIYNRAKYWKKKEKEW